jgi:hypothetical protein
LTTVDQLPVENGIPRHSIIARVAPLPLTMSTDGVVPYESSHVDGVVSEKIVAGSHNCLDEPDVIEELHRILREHINRQNTTTNIGHNENDGRTSIQRR